MKKWFLFLLIAVLSFSFPCCSNDDVDEPENENPVEPVEPDYKLLFVGNSLTYTNNLPGLVKDAAKERDITIETRMLAYPNYAIIDHWADGQVQILIESKEYDYVIIQQGPSSQQEGYRWLLNNGAEYAALCADNDAKLAYYMVWPALEFYHTFDKVIANYSAAARANNAILCPVGQVWKDYQDQTNDFSYYGPDDFHPSLKGSKVAAQVIANSLFP